MLIHVPWNETIRTPQGGFITRKHDLLFDDSIGVYVGEIMNGVPYVGTFSTVESFIPEAGMTFPFIIFHPGNAIIIPYALESLSPVSHLPGSFSFATGIPQIHSFRPQIPPPPPPPPPLAIKSPLKQTRPLPSPPPAPPPSSPRPNNTPYEVSNIYNDPFIKDYLFILISKIHRELSAEKSASFFIKGGSAVELYRGFPEKLVSDIDAILLIDPALSNDAFYTLKLELTSKIIKIMKTHLRTYKDEILAAYRRNSLEYMPESPSFYYLQTILGDEIRLESILKPLKNSIEKNMSNTTTQIPFIVTYNPSLDGQFFSFISLKTKTSSPIPLLEIVIPYRGYPEMEFIWNTRRYDLLERKGIKIPIQSPIQLLFNQRYAAAKSRKNNNRRKRTERANFMRNKIVNPSIKKYMPNLQKINTYYSEKNIASNSYPKEFSYHNLIQNIKPGIDKYFRNNTRKNS